MTTLAAVGVGEVLFVLKIAFLVLLYLFVWRLVRAAARDARAPHQQESFVLAPSQAASLFGQPAPRRRAGRLVVVRSPALAEGHEHVLDSFGITAGRSAQNDLALGDEFASARHARFEPRGDEVWVADAGSTNGTFVNGTRITEERRLEPGDVVTIGETELRFER